MLIRFTQTLTVNEHFQLGRFGQVTVSSAGRATRPPTSCCPAPPANQRQADNNQTRLIIDDASPGPEPRPDPVQPGRRPAQRRQHAARRGHRNRRGGRADLHLGRQRRERQRVPAAARSTRSAASVDFAPENPRGRSAAGRRWRRPGRRGQRAQLLQQLRRLRRLLLRRRRRDVGLPRGRQLAEFERQAAQDRQRAHRSRRRRGRPDGDRERRRTGPAAPSRTWSTRSTRPAADRTRSSIPTPATGELTRPVPTPSRWRCSTGQRRRAGR